MKGTIQDIAGIATSFLHPGGRRPQRGLGEPPGTLRADPDAPPPVLRLFGYGPDDIVEKTLTDPMEAREYLGKWPVVWLNIDGVGDPAVISALGEIFKIHQLVLEDITTIHQRAKAEEYPGQLFVVVRMARADEQLDTEQVSLVLGEGYVVTFQERPGDCLDAVRERLRTKKGRVRDSGADYLAYCLIDAIVDGYFPILEDCGDRLERVEAHVLRSATSNTLLHVRRIKRDLLVFRRAVWPLREAVGSFLRDRHPLITPETSVYLRDCYDHIIQIIDMLETYRELSSGVMDIYMSCVSNRMNEIMKVLTVFAAIFIPLTFIAGIYGMNFNTEMSRWNMPELNTRYGYIGVWIVMLGVAIAMLLFFKIKGWIWTRDPMDQRDSESTE